MEKRKLIYNFQKKDVRDYKFNAVLENINSPILTTINTLIQNKTVIITKTKLVPSFTISNLPKILDQGNLGNCVANAFCYCLMHQTKNNILLSRLFLYANSRCLDFTPLNNDNGTTIRTSCAALKKYGTCKESVYPYIINKYSELPSLAAYSNSKQFKKFTYNFISQDLISLKSNLNFYKTPIIFGFLVYSSFMTEAVAKTGVVPMPNKSSDSVEGGHCVCLVGYNDNTQMFTCANSWGASWGNKGYFYLPYKYVTDSSLASDFCFTTFAY